MTNPEYTVQGLLQALNEIPTWTHCTTQDVATWVKKRAHELSAATPAPAAAGDALLVLRQFSSELTKQWNRCNDATYTMSDLLYAVRNALDDALALANPPPSAGTGDGVEGEGGT